MNQREPRQNSRTERPYESNRRPYNNTKNKKKKNNIGTYPKLELLKNDENS